MDALKELEIIEKHSSHFSEGQREYAIEVLEKDTARQRRLEKELQALENPKHLAKRATEQKQKKSLVEEVFKICFGEGSHKYTAKELREAAYYRIAKHRQNKKWNKTEEVPT